METRRRLGGATRRFVPAGAVRSVLINEALTGSECFFYLCIAVAGDKDLALPFPTTRPRLEQILPVYHALRSAVGLDGEGGG